MSTSFLYERRKQYRLQYPITERPVLTVSGVDYLVKELSEGGLQALFKEQRCIPEDYPFNGVICYLDGQAISVTGKVLRSNEQGFSVHFQKGLSLRLITREQIRLHQKYPNHFTRQSTQTLRH